MTNVAFISHASEDAAVAEVITAYLEQNGISCWIAPRDVDPGSDYSSEIVEAIEASSVFVLVLSEHANESVYVKREVERAVSKGKPVFSIRVREVLPSKSLELFISSPHWIDAWEPPLEQYLERLVQAISAATGAYPAGAHATLSAPAKPSASFPLRYHRLPLRTLLAVAVALLLSGAGWYAYRLLDGIGSVASDDNHLTKTDSAPVGEPSNMEQSAGRVDQVQPSRPTPALAGPEPCPSQLSLNPNLPTPFTCTCSAAAAGSEGVVIGTDVYVDASSLCRAAVHAGAITTKGGPITVERGEGRPYYVGSSRNGVASLDFGSHGASIVFAGTETVKLGPEPCPSQLSLNPNLPTPFTCTCSAAAAGSEGVVIGTDVYVDASSLCRAAVHAGAITTKGGPITVERGEGRPYYVGSSRNGVASLDFGSHGASIVFAGTETVKPGPEPCPSQLSLNPNLPTPFTCTCSAAAAGSGGIVIGTDVYVDASSLCRAAVHAGAITTKGGPITVERGEGRPYYVGSSRNGVASLDFGSHGASIRFK